MMFKYEKRTGALVCDEAIPEVTQELEAGQAKFYGGKFFVGESMSESGAEKIATLLGGELS